MQRTLSPAGLFTKGAALATLLLLAACASPPENDPDALAAYEEANDPLEPANRYMFEVNYAADELLIKPFAGWYYAAIPNYGQDRIRNVLRNLNTPVILANDIFQGEMDRANTTVMRFLINSTVGIGGRTPGVIPERPMPEVNRFHNTYETAKSEAERIVIARWK